MTVLLSGIVQFSAHRSFRGHRPPRSVLVSLLTLLALVWSGSMFPSHGAERTAPDEAKKGNQEPKIAVAQTDLRTMEEEILRLTNVERRREGLNPLRPSSALRFLGRQHSRQMCQTKTLQHESDVFPKGWQRFPERLALIGLQAGGENIAYRTITKKPEEWAQEVVTGWLKSPRHKKNMLNSEYRFLGIGVVPCHDDLAYATQVFSHEPGRTPNARVH